MRIIFRSVVRFGLAALAAVLLAACGQSSAGAPAPAADPEVTVLTIIPRPVTLTTVLSGRTSAFLMSEVRPQVGGIIQKRLFKEGGDVRAGEVLYQIDPATYQAAYDNARAALAKAEANALPARLKAERYANLSQVRAVSKQDNDDAQAAKKQADAEVIAAKAALETARINLGYTRVTAPISGRIGKSAVTPGALVTAGQATAMATIQQTDPVYVDVTQSSTEVLRLKRELASGRIKQSANGGARVSLLMEDGSQYSHEGALQFTDITVDQSTGEVTLRAVFPNSARDLLPGLYVRAVLTEGVDETALLVPQTAISRDPKGNAMVLVVKPDDVVEQRPVVLTRIIGDSWLVGSGLTAGERIIVEGLQKVRAGAKVKAVEAPKPDAAKDAQAEAAPEAKPGAGVEPAKPAAKAEPAKPEAKAAPKAADKPADKAGVKVEKKSEPKADTGASWKPEQAMKPEQAVKPEQADKPANKDDGLPRPKKGEGRAYSPPKGEWPVSSLGGKPGSSGVQ